MTDTVQKLQDCLEQEIALLGQFIGVLQEESNLLLNAGDTDSLAKSTTLKNQYADQIAAWSDQRAALLEQLGVSPDKAGLDGAANQHVTLQPFCQTLYQKAAQARDLNTQNGQLITTFMTHNQQALDTLARLADPGQVYDASGRTKPGQKGPKTRIKAG